LAFIFFFLRLARHQHPFDNLLREDKRQKEIISPTISKAPMWTQSGGFSFLNLDKTAIFWYA
jgi:hypothetical protein